MYIKKVFELNSSDVLEIFLTVGILQECGQDITCKTRLGVGNSFKPSNPGATDIRVKEIPNKKRQKIGIQKEFETFHYEFQMNP